MKSFFCYNQAMSLYFRQNLRKTARYAKLFQAVPFVESLLLNGSTAQGLSRWNSDIDLLTVVKPRRLYTARFLLLILGFATFQKRSKEENKNHSGKFCFNYFSTSDYLKIPTGRGRVMDRYCAENYASSVLISGREEIFSRFFRMNEKLFKKSSFVLKDTVRQELDYYFPIEVSHSAKKIKKIVEKCLSGNFGDWLEIKLKKMQVGLIQKDERTKKYPELIVYKDREARFHPPKESKV
jgi:hypothetical protein